MRGRPSAGLLILLGLTAAAALWLGLERRPERSAEHALLLGLPADRLTEVQVRSASGLVVLRRETERWVLDGTVSDLADQGEAAALVELIGGARAVPLPEPAGEDYGLGQPLLVVGARTADGREAEAAIGDLNPVAHRYYAAVKGRAGIVMVEPELVRRLFALPTPLRLAQLWPRFELAAVDSLRFQRPPLPGHEVVARDPDGSWWLLEPADGHLQVPPAALQRQEIYGDLVRTRDGRRWWRASGLVVDLLLASLKDCVVAEFGPAPAPPETLKAAGLLPPVVTVAAHVDGRWLSVGLGHQMPRARVEAVRQDLPGLLHLTGDPIAPALMPLGGYVDLHALDFRLADADSFRLERHDIAPLTLRRLPDGWAGPGERAQGQGGDLGSDLSFHLDNLPLTGALPPQQTEPLERMYRTTLVAYLKGGKQPRRLELGYLPGDRAAIWEPDTGRLLLVPPQVMVTLRSVITGLARPSR